MSWLALTILFSNHQNLSDSIRLDGSLEVKDLSQENLLTANGQTNNQTESTSDIPLVARSVDPPSTMLAQSAMSDVVDIAHIPIEALRYVFSDYIKPALQSVTAEFVYDQNGCHRNSTEMAGRRQSLPIM
jgi:hypothetical protein